MHAFRKDIVIPEPNAKQKFSVRTKNCKNAENHADDF